MCSINHDLKAIFIHIPKTGEFYTHNILEKYYNFKTIYFLDNIKNNNDSNFLHLRENVSLKYLKGYKHHDELAVMTEEKWNSYYKFTIIRNPYDRIVTAWNFLKSEKKIDDISFENFLNEYSKCNDYVFACAFTTQYKHLLDENNEIKINYMCKTENINEDLVHVLTELGCEIKHQSSIMGGSIINGKNERENYCNFYNEKTIELVNNYFKDDFVNFNFKMCKNMSELVEDSNNYFVDMMKFINKNNKLLDKLNVDNNNEPQSMTFFQFLASKNVDMRKVEKFPKEIGNMPMSKFLEELFTSQKKR